MERSFSINYRKKGTVDWIIERTLMRPRDLIAFLNAAIRHSEGKASISLTALKSAEGTYSRERLDALYDEWGIDYPNLRLFIELLKGRQHHFSASDLTDENILEFISLNEKLILGDFSKQDLLSIASEQFNSTASGDDFRKTFFSVFYRTGVIGLKLDKNLSYAFSHEGERTIARAEITPYTRISIHPCFHRVLGIGTTLLPSNLN